jgi:tetratricopeptide (TPR) repeat protein
MNYLLNGVKFLITKIKKNLDLNISKNQLDKEKQINNTFPENDDKSNQNGLNSNVDAAKYSDLGHLFLRKNDYAQATDNFRLATEINGTKASFYRDLGYALIHKNTYLYNFQLKEKLIAQGNIDEAITCFQRAIELGFHDYYYWTHIFLGDALTIRNRIKEAQPVYQQATRLRIEESKPNFEQQYWDSSHISGPQFLIVGVAKCGTSSLYEYMIRHPQILSAAKKEIDFVNHVNNGIDWYLSHFPPTPNNFVTGEASTSYFAQHKKAIPLFRDLFPQCKLIVMFRNPVDRVISHYHNDVRYSGEKRSLAEVISEELEILQGLPNFWELEKTDYSQKQKGYLVISMYVYFLERWMSVFPKEQLLVLNSEEFFTNPPTNLTTVFKFLGLADYQLSQYPEHNQGSYQKKDYSTEEQELRTKLSKFFQPHNRKLEDYLGIKFNWN